jgi:hypothetical protein
MLPFIFVTLTSLAAIAAGQPSTNATCSPSFAWVSPGWFPFRCILSHGVLQADNSKGQSPCLVAAYLASVCDDGCTQFALKAEAVASRNFTVFLVPALPNELSSYQGPTVAQANQCGCSSVFYSLLSACAECQSGKILTYAQVSLGRLFYLLKYRASWSAFKANCNTVYVPMWDSSSFVWSRLMLPQISW